MSKKVLFCPGKNQFRIDFSAYGRRTLFHSSYLTNLLLARPKIKIVYSVRTSRWHLAWKWVDPFVKMSRPTSKIRPTHYEERVGPRVETGRPNFGEQWMSADCELYIFVGESLQICLVYTNFAADSLAHPVSGWVKTFWKGRLRTLSSNLKLRNFDTRKIRQRDVHFGCIIPCWQH